MANTLKSIAKNGTKDFYEGYIAEDIVNTLNKLGGLHSLNDFAKQRGKFSTRKKPSQYDRGTQETSTYNYTRISNR